MQEAAVCGHSRRGESCSVTPSSSGPPSESPPAAQGYMHARAHAHTHPHTHLPHHHHTASARTACKAARFQPSTPKHQDVSFQLPSPHAPCSPRCRSSSPHVLFSPPGHSLPNALGSWQQLLANDNQMSRSHAPSKQPEPGVCLTALQRAAGSGSALLHGADSSRNPHSEAFIHERQGSRPSAGLCLSRDTRLPAVFGRLWQQWPAESTVQNRAGTAQAGKTSAAWQGTEKKLPCNSYWDQSRECEQPSIHKEVITSESGFPSSSPSCLISKSCSVYQQDK